ncbi:degenerin deg-1-like [Leptopilina heterotoma]|uniref:degenerin deg-1-like n=1 Tax=Leptopilina heterotoma TaxID=63436 RepID=UPI001CA8EBC8|nr:degenerin deg-1-like [Leptopilina heterotoma]
MFLKNFLAGTGYVKKEDVWVGINLHTLPTSSTTPTSPTTSSTMPTTSTPPPTSPTRAKATKPIGMF